MRVKFLHIIPPDVAKAYQIVDFITKNFPEEEHDFLIMQTRNWVMQRTPRLLGFLNLKYLPEVNRNPFSKIGRIRSVMKSINEAEHVVLHSIFCIKGMLFLPLICRKHYAQKCIWIEMYTDIIRWKRPGNSLKLRLRNGLLGHFLKSIPIVGCMVPSDQDAYDEYVGGKAQFILSPLPVVESIQKLALKCLKEHRIGEETADLYDVQKILHEWELVDEADAEYSDTNQTGQSETNRQQASHGGEKQMMAPCLRNKDGSCHMIMVEGEMFDLQDHSCDFMSLKHLTDTGIIVANLNHIGTYCYSGSSSYRVRLRRSGKNVLENRFVDFIRPKADREFFYRTISGVDAMVLFNMRTMNLDLMWIMLLMNKKVFMPMESPLYKCLRANEIPVFPCESITKLNCGQFLLPLKTNDCKWMQKFLNRERAAECWKELFNAAECMQGGGNQ